MRSGHTSWARSRWGRFPAVVAIVLSAVAVGCGGDDEGGGSSNDSGGEGGQSDYVANVKAELEKYYEGTYTGPPDSAPQAKPGQNVWLISFGQAAGIAANAIGGAEDAGKKLGWDMTVVDGKFDPAVWGAGIRQAIADNADGIILYIIDCNLVKGPLRQARAAGVEVVGLESLDCNETNPGEEPLFSGAPTYVEGPYVKWIEEYGRAQAVWAIAQTAGKANILYPRTDETQGFSTIRKGTEKELEKCPECQIEYYEFKNADLGPTLRQKTEQALLRNPDTNAMILSVDALVTGGVAAALQASGRVDQISVIGSEGDPAIMDIIREGKAGSNAGVGIPPRYEGYAGIDALIRLFAGEKVEGSGIGLQIYDKDHNLSQSGGYEAPIDFEADYARAWGVE